MNLRCANPLEADRLDDIALKAKAHWGYTAEQLAAWKPSLLTSPESIANRPTFVAEVDGTVVAFSQVAPEARPSELVALWVLPQYMGRGIGSALLRQALRAIASLGESVLAIDSDPNAEQFYVAKGAVVVGYIPAPVASQPQRTRPQLVLFAQAA